MLQMGRLSGLLCHVCLCVWVAVSDTAAVHGPSRIVEPPRLWASRPLKCRRPSVRHRPPPSVSYHSTTLLRATGFEAALPSPPDGLALWMILPVSIFGLGALNLLRQVWIGVNEGRAKETALLKEMDFDPVPDDVFASCGAPFPLLPEEVPTPRSTPDEPIPEAFVLYLIAVLVNFDPRWQEWWRAQQRRVPPALVPSFVYCRDVRRRFVRGQFLRSVQRLTPWVRQRSAVDWWVALQKLRRDPDGDEQVRILLALLSPAQQITSLQATLYDALPVYGGCLPRGLQPLPADRLCVGVGDCFEPPRLPQDVFSVVGGKEEVYVLMAERDRLVKYYQDRVLSGSDAAMMEAVRDPVDELTRWLADGTSQPLSAADLCRPMPEAAPRWAVDRVVYGALGAAAFAAVGCLAVPLECLAVQQQVFGTDGWTALRAMAFGQVAVWNGVGPALLVGIGRGALLFLLLERYAPAFVALSGPELQSLPAALSAGVTAAAVSTMATHPLEVAKLLQFLQPGPHDWIWTLHRVLQQHGLRAWYTGFPQALLCNACFVSAALLGYSCLSSPRGSASRGRGAIWRGATAIAACALFAACHRLRHAFLAQFLAPGLAVPALFSLQFWV
eukprot:EG_transcript_6903